MRICIIAAAMLLLLIAPLGTLRANSDGGEWDDRFDALGLDRRVHAVASDGPDIYVGGQFRYAGDVLVKKIARWDGIQWHALGKGVFRDDRYVADIVVYDGEVYACGTFEQIGNRSVNHVARWNGKVWSPLGTGSPAAVYALTVFDGQIYAGGVGWLARWDGSAWNDVGSPAGAVKCLATSVSHLYVGGGFTDLGGTPLLNLAKGDGSSWTPLGGGLEGFCSPEVSDLWVAGSNVYAVGSFFREPGSATPLRGVGQWDGTTWNAIGSGLSQEPSAPCDEAWGLSACELDGELVIGGSWQKVDGQDIPFLARWDGADWKSFGSGVNGTVNALSEHDGTLIIGGDFTLAGSHTSRHFAIWTPSIATGVGEVPPPGSGAYNISAYPNPFNPITTITYALDRAAHVNLGVFDASGNHVATLVEEVQGIGQHTVEWHGLTERGLPVASGIYFVRIQAAGSVGSTKLILLK